jgi:hypothetical protein
LHGAVLGADDWFGAGQRGQGLVAVAGQQQALQTGTEAAALRQRAEQGVELGGVVLEWAGCRWQGRRLVIATTSAAALLLNPRFPQTNRI